LFSGASAPHHHLAHVQLHSKLGNAGREAFAPFAASDGNARPALEKAPQLAGMNGGDIRPLDSGVEKLLNLLDDTNVNVTFEDQRKNGDPSNVLGS
jgi:hypothetical protein